MSRSTIAARLTYEDLLKLPDDDKRHELIDGVHYVMSSPVLRHQRVVRRLGVSIANFVDATGRGEVFFVDVDVVLSPYDVVVPDLIFVSEERKHLLQEKNVPGPPDLAAEVLSPSTRHKDRVLKRRLFEREKVQEYWILDSEKNSVRVYLLGAAGYGEGVELSAAAGHVLSSPLLPGWNLPLSTLFA
ncbi:MAG TPA: Uma2 family endonuclease [Thermoanaerobaculia bacterium]|jgi:Uma2 family endonuclease|nr:Uma2 family endonuclease [Thermoanaerobaculia bacterium]